MGASPRSPHGGPAPRPALVAVVLVVALALALAVTLARSDQRLAGRNSVKAEAFVLQLAPGARACQSGERPPPDAAALRFVVGTYGRPGQPLDVAVAVAGDRRERRRFPAGAYRDGGPVDVPLREEPRAGGPVIVCVRNAGRRAIALAGPQSAFSQVGRGRSVRVRSAWQLQYVRAEKESWASLAGTVSERFGRAKATVFGTWTLWVAALLVAAAGALGLTVTLAGMRP